MTQFNRNVVRQLGLNRGMLKIHAHSQMRLDQFRAESAMRSIAANDAVLATGAMRNMVLGVVLPAAMAAAETRRLHGSRK